MRMAAVSPHMLPGRSAWAAIRLPLGGSTSDSGWNVRCRASDDPWPMYQSGDASSAPALKAFYNPARNFFTGVVTPSIGVDLPAFYSAGMIPRAAGGAALLIAGIDGKVHLVENGAMRSIGRNTRLGKRFRSDALRMRSAARRSSRRVRDEATSDSLRAFEIPALEAVPASAPLAMDGTVTALWTAQDGKSVLVAGAQPRQANTRWTVLRRFAISALAGGASAGSDGANASALWRHAARGDRGRSLAAAGWTGAKTGVRRADAAGCERRAAACAGLDVGIGWQQSSLAVSAAPWRAFSRWLFVDVGNCGGIVDGFVRSGLSVDRSAKLSGRWWCLQATRRCPTCRRCWRAISI